ncbi:MAG: hypothetical protein PHY29_10190 [Syntrophales bacterium]|nr:hypothetical protein [Syntrophales bacterium]
MFKRNVAVLIGVFFVLMFLPPASMALTGGPDAGGYRYYDSDEKGAAPFDWKSIFYSGVPISDFKAEGTGVGSILSGPFDIGFSFTFYGVEYRKVYVSKYGYLTFNDGPPLASCSLQEIPTRGGSADNFIAGMWAYLHPGA